jgi:mersacidin/lichenicidin family type 2 lantibiotic
MSHRNIIRAWKDPEYRASLTAEELALIPSNPAGEIELSDAELEAVSGAALPRTPLCPTVPKKSIERGNCPTFLCSGFFCAVAL